nr:H-2 class I histocompatibility antigen, Q10 alpha chain-like isoform X2 [Manis javanica]
MAELAKVQLEDKPWPRGTHSLRYHYLALSAPGPDLPQFLAVGYVDDHPFIQYDSHADRAEPQVPWMAPLDAQYWETETQKQRVWAKVQQVETWMVMGYHNHSSGMHSTQRMFGCEVQEDGHSSAFWQFGFDGQDHLSLDLETLSWVSAKHVAIGTKRWWEAERCYAEYDKAYLESICLSSLRRYLELGGQSFTRREPPRVHVTGRTAQAGGTMLKCWALGFYPQDISLSWWLGEEELALETETTLSPVDDLHHHCYHHSLAGGWNCVPGQEVPSRWNRPSLLPKPRWSKGCSTTLLTSPPAQLSKVFWSLEVPCTGWLTGVI